jgi:hypothetical protein
VTRRGLRRRLPALAAAVLATLAAFGAGTSSSARAGDAAESSEAFLARISPAIVSIDAVVRVELTMMGQSQTSEEKQALTAVVVDPSGVLMTGYPGQAMKAFEERGASIKLVPTRLLVTVGNETKEHEAAVLARDSNLDLVFLQVVDLGDATMAALDLSKGTTPQIGQALLGVRRLDRGFDRAPELLRASIAEHVTQPRPMWGMSGDFASSAEEDMGLPVFDAAGTVAGVVSMQMAFGAPTERPVTRPFVLPLEPVRAALAAAKKRAPEVIAEAKKAAAEGAMSDAPPPEAPMDGAPMGEDGMGEAPRDGGK